MIRTPPTCDETLINSATKIVL